MVRRRWAVAFLAVFVLAAGAALGARAARPGGEARLRFQGQVRSYRVHVPPSYTGKRPVPLVLVLHGATANAEWIEKDTGFSAKADQEGFIVVYPDGSGTARRDGHFWNSGGMRLPTAADDVGFLRALIQNLQQQYRIDPGRIYVTGMSNGGMMAHRVGCELGDVVAAIGPVAGTLNVTYSAGPPVSVIMVHGGRDRSVPLEGGPPFFSAPMSTTVQTWVKRDGCKVKPERTDRGGITKERYTGGKGGAEVVLYVVKDGQHAWPHRNAKDASGLDATDVIWEFFAKHPKR